MTEYQHSGDRKVRHAPLVHEKDLTMRREKRSASPREEIGWARLKEVSNRHDGHNHPNEGIAELEKRRGKRRKGGKTTRPNKGRALERGGNTTNSKLDAPARRGEVEKAVKSKHSPIGHREGGTRPGEV